jgi:hypothetical protein
MGDTDPLSVVSSAMLLVAVCMHAAEQRPSVLVRGCVE